MSKGFTFVELLIVIGIMAILMTMVIIAINPNRQFMQAHNAQRWSHVNALVNAVYQNIIDNGGSFSCAAGALPTSATVMGSATGSYNICDCLVPTYIASMPYDPTSGSYTSCTTYDSGYTITYNASTTRMTIAAPDAELGASISISR